MITAQDFQERQKRINDRTQQFEHKLTELFSMLKSDKKIFATFVDTMCPINPLISATDQFDSTLSSYGINDIDELRFCWVELTEAKWRARNHRNGALINPVDSITIYFSAEDDQNQIEAGKIIVETAKSINLICSEYDPSFKVSVSLA